MRSDDGFVDYKGLPPDGIYEVRMDEEDFDVLTIRVSDGKAYKQDGQQRFFLNHQWKKVGDL